MPGRARLRPRTQKRGHRDGHPRGNAHVVGPATFLWQQTPSKPDRRARKWGLPGASSPRDSIC